jgi:flavin-dependent dehydrogenase
LLDNIAASNCPPITQAIFDVGEFALRGSAPPTDGVAEAYGPRRKILDKILLDAAIEAGVEVREAFTVEEILMEAERVSGIRGRAKNGSTVTEKSAIVIGANGMHSRRPESASLRV